MTKYASPPLTVTRIATDLRGLGVREGETLLVHTSLRAIAGPDGFVLGGGVAVIAALREALGATGTLVMPAHSASCSEPSNWSNPPVDPTWWPTIRELWPAYREDATPTQGIGVVPELFRAMAGVRRSAHPQLSFCALGPEAPALLEEHVLEEGLGERSPLGALHRSGARVLLLGCSFGSCTAFHLAEHRIESVPSVEEGAPMLRDGRRAWVPFRALAYDASDFEALGAALETRGGVQAARVGQATARLFEMRDAVDFATRWLQTHRVPEAELT